MTTYLKSGSPFLYDSTTNKIVGIQQGEGDDSMFAFSTNTLTEAECNFLDGATAGTVVASKAVIADANKDVGGFRNIDVGASGLAGTMDVFPSTASKGKTIYAAVDNTGDTTITYNNVAHGQASIYSQPDSGLAQAYLLASTAALTVAEVDVLDGATAGTGVASKAMVLNATAEFTFPASHTFRKTPVALTATAAMTALLNSGRLNYVTGTDAAAYTLPEATGTGDEYTFVMGEVNTNGTTFVGADTANVNIYGCINILDMDSNAQTAYFGAAGDDTITFNGTTSGGQIGDKITFTDLATDVWTVHGNVLCAAGSNVADMFSSAA